MNIYFSGIGGVGIGSLAMIAKDAGNSVSGSDPHSGLMAEQLKKHSVSISDDQSGEFLRSKHADQSIDWFVHTAALPSDHAELKLAKELGIKTSKRDELIAHIVTEKNLKLIAVSGTHGKTTTTGMLIWLAKYFSIPVSYSIGTTLSWAPSGKYTPGSEYFIYECDEFDRNFLAFNPFISLITTIEHDHADTYPTKSEYFEAFKQFAHQSEQIITWKEYDDLMPAEKTVLVEETSPYLRLPGEHNRRNASLILAALEKFNLPAKYAADGLNKFPGTNRRFENLAKNLYSDYGHTPSEIKATLQMARELAKNVTLVYQPHQNIRQHEIRDQYTDEVFENASEIYWLPTYLSREKPGLEILKPEGLTKNLKKDNLHLSEMNNDLWQSIEIARQENKLVLCMGAGDIDDWVREKSRQQI